MEIPDFPFIHQHALVQMVCILNFYFQETLNNSILEFYFNRTTEARDQSLCTAFVHGSSGVFRVSFSSVMPGHEFIQMVSSITHLPDDQFLILNNTKPIVPNLPVADQVHQEASLYLHVRGLGGGRNTPDLVGETMNTFFAVTYKTCRSFIWLLIILL